MGQCDATILLLAYLRRDQQVQTFSRGHYDRRRFQQQELELRQERPGEGKSEAQKETEHGRKSVIWEMAAKAAGALPNISGNGNLEFHTVQEFP